MSKLTPDLQQKLLTMLELGVPIKYACEAVGISEQIYYVWVKLGQKKQTGKYVEFFESVQSIPGKAMARKLAHLEKAAEKGNVSANIWFLEHKYPEIFGNKTEIVHSGKIDTDIVFKFEVKQDGDNSTKDASAETKRDVGSDEDTSVHPV